ncbi:hypothetical protein ABW20_dc0102066 [Dactylellina cionopaga]|nr:hypothetical protein ABW20_dc0102066 [Dactylellina cionopaga]
MAESFLGGVLAVATTIVNLPTSFTAYIHRITAPITPPTPPPPAPPSTNVHRATCVVTINGHQLNLSLAMDFDDANGVHHFAGDESQLVFTTPAAMRFVTGGQPTPNPYEETPSRPRRSKRSQTKGALLRGHLAASTPSNFLPPSALRLHAEGTLFENMSPFKQLPTFDIGQFLNFSPEKGLVAATPAAAKRGGSRLHQVQPAADFLFATPGHGINWDENEENEGPAGLFNGLTVTKSLNPRLLQLEDDDEDTSEDLVPLSNAKSRSKPFSQRILDRSAKRRCSSGISSVDARVPLKDLDHNIGKAEEEVATDAVKPEQQQQPQVTVDTVKLEEQIAVDDVKLDEQATADTLSLGEPPVIDTIKPDDPASDDAVKLNDEVSVHADEEKPAILEQISEEEAMILDSPSYKNLPNSVNALKHLVVQTSRQLKAETKARIRSEQLCAYLKTEGQHYKEDLEELRKRTARNSPSKVSEAQLTKVMTITATPSPPGPSAGIGRPTILTVAVTDAESQSQPTKVSISTTTTGPTTRSRSSLAGASQSGSSTTTGPSTRAEASAMPSTRSGRSPTTRPQSSLKTRTTRPESRIGQAVRPQSSLALRRDAGAASSSRVATAATTTRQGPTISSRQGLSSSTTSRQLTSSTSSRQPTIRQVPVSRQTPTSASSRTGGLTEQPARRR